MWKHSEANTQAPLPQIAGPPYRACLWLCLELEPFQVHCTRGPPPNWDPLASQATQGHSSVV